MVFYPLVHYGCIVSSTECIHYLLHAQPCPDTFLCLDSSSTSAGCAKIGPWDFDVGQALSIQNCCNLIKRTVPTRDTKQLQSQTPLRTAWPTVRGGWGERGDVRRRDDRPAVKLAGKANFAVFGEVTGVHIRDDCLVDGRLDTARYIPAARLGYHDYTFVREVRELRRPKDPA